MLIDSHVHFLVYNPQEHVWVTDELGALKASFLPNDIEPLLTRAGFEGCVAVEARQMPKENDWLLSLARSHQVIKGVVGWVDLTAPDITTRLEALAIHPEIKGFRHVVIDEPDEGFLLRDDFRRGIAALGPFGFTYDLLIRLQHMPAAVQLVRKFPQQRFVLDHLGLPDISGKQLGPWKSGLKELTALPNVFIKLSGLVYRADWQRWRAEDFTPYIDVALERFGPKRLMLGSNWSVCTVGGKYDAVIHAYLDGIQLCLQKNRPRSSAALVFVATGSASMPLDCDTPVDKRLTVTADLFSTHAMLEPIPMKDAEAYYLRHLPLAQAPDIILRRLIDEVPWRAENIIVWGKTYPQPRLIAWYGYAGMIYTYSGIQLTPLPWTGTLLDIKKRVEAVAGTNFNSVLVNYYRDHRDSMGLHSDDEPELGERPILASLSLGEERTFILKHKRDKTLKPVRLKLASGSLLVMKGNTQRYWKHGIDKETRPCGPRINLTFRRILT